jgi:hypothetical protein
VSTALCCISSSVASDARASSGKDVTAVPKRYFRPHGRCRWACGPGESLPRDEPLSVGNGLDPLADPLR